MKKITLAVLGLLFFVNTSLADVIELKNGDVLEGRIVGVDQNQILAEVTMNGDILTSSFEGSQIARIKLEPFELPLKLVIFDRLYLGKAGYFSGLIELEMPDAIYFSLLLKQGSAIVRFSQNEIIGVERSYGFKRVLAKAFFGFKRTAHRVKIFFLETVGRKRTKKITEGDAEDALNRIEEKKQRSKINDITAQVRNGDITQQEAAKMIEDLAFEKKVYSIEDFQKAFKKYLNMDEGELFQLGVKEKSLMLGMLPEQVIMIWGEPIDIKKASGLDTWYYPEGYEAVFYDGKLVSYSKSGAGIPLLLKRYYSHVLEE